MRLLVLTTSYPRRDDDWAGGFVRGLSRWLVAAGHEVTVLAAGDGARREAREERGLRVVRLPGRGLFYGAGAPEALASPEAWARVPPFVLRMAAEAFTLAQGADAIVSHWLLPSALVGAALARGRPHLAVAHSGDVALCERLPLGAGAGVALALSATGARLAFVSDNLRARFLALAGDGARRVLSHRSIVCPMGIDVGALKAAASRQPSEAGRLEALFLGRLVPIKGAAVAARACAALPGVALHVAGDGPEARGLVGATLHGEVGFVRKRELLNQADALVLPSLALPGGRTEGAPTVLMEAMAAGLAIVASRSGGVCEIVRDGETALLVPPGDEAALRAALARLRDDVALRLRLGAAAAAAAARFDWRAVGPRLMAALAA